LTGIYNRRQFFILANMEFKKALRYGRDISILMLDLDFFKRINDTYGHAIGDRVLQLTAKIIKENLRSVDIFARYGGEEFVIVLPETNLTGALQVAERIRSNIEKTPLTVNDKVEINITISIGLCSETVKKSESTSIEKIIEKADQSLYEAKRLGRNRVCIYSHSLP
ncbi:MAG: GGDEF domain-containing protein, partial [Thermodesulfovibrionales bacterium]|nr:GGDEF domain-containing protein [Thermodesulfovibrionales bacterium]